MQYEEMNLDELKKELTKNKRRKTNLSKKRAELLKAARETIPLGIPSIVGLRNIGKSDEYNEISREDIQVNRNIKTLEEFIEKLEGPDDDEAKIPEGYEPVKPALETPEGMKVEKMD